jgi:hypothetical protein
MPKKQIIGGKARVKAKPFCATTPGSLDFDIAE